MDSIMVRARAKINPALDVLGIRPDGYHELRMIMQSLRLHDSLLIRKTATRRLTLACDRDNLPVDARNLAYRAAEYILREYAIDCGVSIYLRKRIPVAAGLAGGSSDCAAVLNGMNRLFNLGITEKQLMETGLRFGADVPFCLMNGTALAEGVGEKLTRLPPHPAVWVALVKPPYAVSTAAVFRQYNPAKSHERPDISAMTDALDKQDLPRVAASFGNGLTAVTTQMHPEVNELILLMRKLGALSAAMSGSGPTVFGYFTEKSAATYALREIKQTYPLIHEMFITGVYNEQNT